MNIKLRFHGGTLSFPWDQKVCCRNVAENVASKLRSGCYTMQPSENK